MLALPVPSVWEIHPMLVHFPIALLLIGVGADFRARRRPGLTSVAAGLLVLGVIFGWIAGGAGFLAFYTVPAHTDDAHTLMWWHLGLAVATLVVFSWVAVKRWRSRTTSATGGQLLLSSFGVLLLLATGYLGGVIVYHGGAGVQPELLSQEIRGGHDHSAGHESHSEPASSPAP